MKEKPVWSTVLQYVNSGTGHDMGFPTLISGLIENKPKKANFSNPSSSIPAKLPHSENSRIKLVYSS